MAAFIRSRVELLERDKGAFRPRKGSAYAAGGPKVSFPVDYVPPVKEDGAYPFVDIYAYPGRKNTLERAFAATRIPTGDVVVQNVSGHLMRKHFYRNKLKTGFALTLVPLILVAAALAVCFA